MIRSKLGLLASVPLLALAGGVSAAAAATAIPHGLSWQYPHTVTSGVAAAVASVSRCPAVPSGDSAVVQVTLSYGVGGSNSDTLPIGTGGSWKGTVNFVFSGVGGTATISAECLDLSRGGVPLAKYKPHSVTLVS